MAPETILLTLAGVAAGLYAVVALVAYLRKHWPELVLPGTEETAAASPGAAAHTVGPPGTHAGPPSPQPQKRRWPFDPAERRGEAALRTWFAGKSCAICGRSIPPVHRVEQHPGLMDSASPAHDLISWEDIPRDDRLPAVLDSHAPVCASCIMAETFRRQYPDLVIERPEHGRNQRDVH